MLVPTEKLYNLPLFKKYSDITGNKCRSEQEKVVKISKTGVRYEQLWFSDIVHYAYWTERSA